MFEKVRNTIEENALLDQDDGVVVAVSGGPDSIALLHVLHRLQKAYNLRLYVCHLNHQLRGEASDGDAAFVKAFAAQLGLESFIFSRDIEHYAQEHRMSFEEAARESRYKLFDHVLDKTGATKIAVGQNMNDQAETLLMRLFRGAGLEGLTAIKFKRDHIIRPLLSVSRAEIEEYIHEEGLTTRTDHTNFQTDYTRNKIRLEVLPYIETHFNPNIVKRLFETSQLLRDDHDFIQSQVEEVYKKIVKHDEKIHLKDLRLHPALLSRVIRRLILAGLGSLKEVSNHQINDVIRLIESGKHGNCVEIRTLVFQISYADLLVYKKAVSGLKKSKFQMDQPFVYKGHCLYADTLPSSDRTKNNITIDMDKIQGTLYVRTRQPGDRFAPLGMKGTKKLSDFFVDAKVPARLRDEVLLLCDDDTIVWVVGYRMSELYKIDSTTQMRMTFKYTRC